MDATHSFSAPLFILSGILGVGGLLWLFVDADKPLILANDKKLQYVSK